MYFSSPLPVITLNVDDLPMEPTPHHAPIPLLTQDDSDGRFAVDDSQIGTSTSAAKEGGEGDTQNADTVETGDRTGEPFLDVAPLERASGGVVYIGDRKLRALPDGTYETASPSEDANTSGSEYLPGKEVKTPRREEKKKRLKKKATKGGVGQKRAKGEHLNFFLR